MSIASLLDSLNLGVARTLDGSGNNLDNPDWGSAKTLFVRLTAPSYTGPNDPDGDGIIDYDLGGMAQDVVFGGTYPTARSVSNAVMDEPTGDIPNTFGFNEFGQFYGQLLTHDIAETELGLGQPNPPGDVLPPPLFQGLPFGFIRTPGHAQVNEDGLVVREQENDETSFLDLSMVYGTDELKLTLLRRLDDSAYMLTGDGDSIDGDATGQNLLPTYDEVADHHDFAGGGAAIQALFDPFGTAFPETQFAAGDNRVNQNGALITHQTMWMRNHNWHVDRLKALFPEWSSDDLFDAARLLNEAEWQQTVYGEYLKKLVGENAISQYRGYDATVDPSIINEFTTAAFRFGHDQSNNAFDTLAEDGSVVGNDLTLAGSFAGGNTATVVRSAAEVDDWLRGQLAALTQEIDGKVVDGNRNFLFGIPGAPPVDLETFDIQRGRDHGINNYNAVREGLGLSTYATFDAFIAANGIEAARGAALKAVYGDDIGKLDTVVGGLLEQKAPGSMLGETFTILTVIQFERIRDGDRFYFENRLADEPELIQAIKDVSLADIIGRTSGIEHVHYDGFAAHQRIAATGNIDGSDGADLIIGLGGANALRGHDGDDHLVGNAGNDALRGDRGSDAAVGGAGADRFIVANADMVAGDVDWLQDLDLAAGDSIVLGGPRTEFGSAIGRDGRVANEATLAAIVEEFQSDFSLATNAHNVTVYDEYAESARLVLEWRGYQLLLDGYGHLGGDDGVAFRVGDTRRETAGLSDAAESWTRYAAFAPVGADPNPGDGRQLLVSDFNLWEGDRLTLAGWGTVDDIASFRALRSFFVGKLDVDGDGVANDLYFQVDAGANANPRQPGEGYDIIFQDIAGREVDDFNGLFLA